jgi:uncharacterized repeat protein (TIGR01451 family)
MHIRRFLTVLPVITFVLTLLLAAPAWAAPRLSVTKTDSPDPVRVGDTLTYTITVTNTGTGNDARNVTLEDFLPANTTFVSAEVTSGAGNCTEPAVGSTGRTVRCNLGDIAPAGSREVTIQVKPTAAAGEAGFVDNTASAEGSGVVHQRPRTHVRGQSSYREREPRAVCRSP